MIFRKAGLKKVFVLALAALVCFFQMAVGSASAAELDAATRTVKLNEQGDTVTLSLQQVVKGRRLFNSTCGTCHANGVTKTDFNLGLDPETLALATPPRDSVEAIVDYLKNPTTYDGEEEIAERHPSLKSTDIFPKMRDLSEQDLTAIAGHVVLMPKVMGDRWGGGKIYY